MDMSLAKQWLDKSTVQALELIENPSKIDGMLNQLEEKLKVKRFQLSPHSSSSVLSAR